MEVTGTKISQLDPAGTLAGTEVAPIVQSGTTVKVALKSISDIDKSTDNTYHGINNYIQSPIIPDGALPTHAASLGQVSNLINGEEWYGIEWDITITNPSCTRIGKASLHQSLPIQSGMRRCLLSDTGVVNYFLHPSNSLLLDNGAYADLSGSSGQIMVEIPPHYEKFEIDGTKRRCKISTYALPGFYYCQKQYVSAYEATVQRSTLKLSSVVNLSTDYRGGGNLAAEIAHDADGGTSLGKPATTISLTNFRAYARNRGSIEWNCYTYQMQRKLFWLFAVEYANFNSQDTYNAALTGEGYRQGGLGVGVTDLVAANIVAMTGATYSCIPCGITNELGNKTGIVAYTMPFEYDSNGSANYIGEYNATTAYVAGNYVSSGTSLYVCILASTGNAVTNTTYFTPVTRKTVNVPSYHGVENPFGHLWKWTDGCKCMIQSDASGGISEFYVCDIPANFTSSGVANYELRGYLPRSNGYVKEVILGEFGEIMPLSVGAGSTTFFCDYFYTSKPETGVSERGVLFGGHANNGAIAGFVCANTNPAASSAYAHFGSRLCFVPQIEA